MTLNIREQKRLMVLNDVERGGTTAGEGAELLGLSLRQVRRLLAAYRREGAAALAHGNRGRRPHNAIDEGIKKRVVALARSRYTGFNAQHFTELLSEREGLTVSRSSVRRLLLGEGIRSPRKRRPPKHRSRRERYPQEGMLLQIDASHHDWLKGRGPRLALIGAVDDATGKVVHALFREREDSLGYFQLLKQIVAACGVPVALYHDGHAVFERPGYEPETLEEQLEGRKHRTQFGRLVAELNITSIRSRSPQARGRIERMWGTLQDRLVNELCLVQASTTEEANKVLHDYLPRHNRHFVVQPAVPGSAFRPAQRNPDEVFCFKYSRTAGLDNVIRFGQHRLQILPSNGRASYSRARVEIRQSLEGALTVYYQGQPLGIKPAPAEAANLRKAAQATTAPPANLPTLAIPPKRCYAKPAPNHPWRGKFRMHVDKG